MVVLERIETNTESQSMINPTRQRVYSNIEGPSITVCQNPSVDGNIGYLLAKETNHKRGVVHRQCDHFEISRQANTLTKVASFAIVSEERATKANFQFYFLLGNNIVPRPTLTPYQRAPLSIEEHRQYLAMVKDASIAMNIRQLDQLIVERTEHFSLGADGLLFLPPDYASLLFVSKTR